MRTGANPPDINWFQMNMRNMVLLPGYAYPLLHRSIATCPMPLSFVFSYTYAELKELYFIIYARCLNYFQKNFAYLFTIVGRNFDSHHAKKIINRMLF